MVSKKDPCHFFKSAALALASLLVAAIAPRPSSAVPITIPTVPVGNAGNAPDPATGNAFGSVSYDYRIGKTEVTNAQYAEFLNSKAASDTLELYDPRMGSDANGGITRSGVSGSYSYSTKPNMGDKPVNYVSWYDAIRFANWLHNGQGVGDTEAGAYTLLGGTPTPSNGESITRNAGATWFLPSDDEWYKAAYHQPEAQGGPIGGYWQFPTASDSAPIVATANSLGLGDISNPGANVANYNLGAHWTTVGSVTTVASAGPLSESYYGTSDQGGNVWEWNEALISGFARGLRGGSFVDDQFSLVSWRWDWFNPHNESRNIGFRVATVPEPSTLLLGGCGTVALLFAARRRTRRRAENSPTPTRDARAIYDDRIGTMEAIRVER